MILPVIMKKVNNISQKCGVYVFLDGKNKFLYIGKAKNLRKRIKSHFIQKSFFIPYAKDIKVIETDSEISALIL